MSVISLRPAQARETGTDISHLPAWARHFSRCMHQETDTASLERMVYQFASDRDGEMVCPGPAGSPGLRYAATGLPVTESSRTYFYGLSWKVLFGRLALYNEEMSRGTPVADIFDRLQVYMSRQPADYLDMMNWFGKDAFAGSAVA